MFHLGRREACEIAVDGVDPAGKHVLASKELGHITIPRRCIDVARGAGLLDLPAIHHHDHVRQRNRLQLRVRDMHEGDSEIALHPLQLKPHAYS